MEHAPNACFAQKALGVYADNLGFAYSIGFFILSQSSASENVAF
ncbi:hypothetical protein SDC9_105427 [bioreactor metagenome]|uniref:Uncharacterized protein n=1 Tax=bioreactor metagenome TaxID=1076179 RepID=A0A645B0M4_9ZZZZ